MNYSDIVICSNNCDGVNKKTEILKAELNRTQSKIFTLQETHLSSKGKLQINEMHIFEAIRKKEHGLMIGVHVSNHPILISEYSDTFEMLVVDKSIRKKYQSNNRIWPAGKYRCER